jgi:transcriptional regulator with XRE-family HTH domain
MARAINPSALQEIRKLVGLTQRELSRRAGLHPGTVNSIEAGAYPITPATQRKLADVLGVKLDAITIPVPEPEEVAS